MLVILIIFYLFICQLIHTFDYFLIINLLVILMYSYDSLIFFHIFHIIALFIVIIFEVLFYHSLLIDVIDQFYIWNFVIFLNQIVMLQFIFEELKIVISYVSFQQILIVICYNLHWGLNFIERFYQILL